MQHCQSQNLFPPTNCHVCSLHADTFMMGFHILPPPTPILPVLELCNAAEVQVVAEGALHAGKRGKSFSP
eukprot:1155839-Pelagomonas_calceolata.AAC.20